MQDESSDLCDPVLKEDYRVDNVILKKMNKADSSFPVQQGIYRRAVKVSIA